MPLVGRSPAPAPEFARSSGREGGKGIKRRGFARPKAKTEGRRVSGDPARSAKREGRTGIPFFRLRGREAALLFPSSSKQDTEGVTVDLPTPNCCSGGHLSDRGYDGEKGGVIPLAALFAIIASIAEMSS
ncbi:hypothetical protein A6R70_25745 [Agrobacterium rubi]|nr:hypothetical protein [Agrobacterium rubi]